MITFLNEVRAELGNITWPSRSETIRLSVQVIVISAFIGIYLGAADYLFTQLLAVIIK